MKNPSDSSPSNNPDETDKIFLEMMSQSGIVDSNDSVTSKAFGMLDQELTKKSEDEEKQRRYESQKALLEQIKERHQAERQASGITAQIIDLIPEETIQGSLQNIDIIKKISGINGETNSITENIQAKATYKVDNDGQSSLRAVSVNLAYRTITESDDISEKIVTGSQFDRESTDLLFKQVDELNELISNGTLPDLQYDLSAINKNSVDGKHKHQTD